MQSYYQIQSVIDKELSQSGKIRSDFSSLVLWRSVVEVASLLRSQFTWRLLYDGQLSCGQFAVVSCRVSTVFAVIKWFYSQYFLFCSFTLSACQVTFVVHYSLQHLACICSRLIRMSLKKREACYLCIAHCC